MMVFWQQRLAFLATPKTASTAIEAALGSLATLVVQRPRALKHTDATRFERFLQPYLSDSRGEPFEVVALMREPRDWLGSWYRDRQREDVAPELSTAGMSFDSFVRAYCAPGKRPAFADVSSQAEFLTTPSGAQMPHLFRYEAMEAFVRFLEDRLDCEILLPRLNVSPKGNTNLDPETLDLLRKAMAQDFALYAGLGA
ncbi:MAG: hypothetical protein E6Q73_04230 [Pseudorhodobacter sp.]|nr:MAG: hypothetical protein E6Q73_04230 [Pseudorhodobacter sp.]